MANMVPIPIYSAYICWMGNGNSKILRTWGIWQTPYLWNASVPMTANDTSKLIVHYWKVFKDNNMTKWSHHAPWKRNQIYCLLWKNWQRFSSTISTLFIQLHNSIQHPRNATSEEWVVPLHYWWRVCKFNSVLQWYMSTRKWQQLQVIEYNGILQNRTRQSPIRLGFQNWNTK